MIECKHDLWSVAGTYDFTCHNCLDRLDALDVVQMLVTQQALDKAHIKELEAELDRQANPAVTLKMVQAGAKAAEETSGLKMFSRVFKAMLEASIPDTADKEQER